MDIKECGDPNNDMVTFSWELNTNCQYRCTYCYAHNMLTPNFNPLLHNVYKVVLARLKLKTVKKFNVELLGGEPLLHPHICEIIDQLHGIDACKNIVVNTNLAKPKKFYEKFNDKKYTKLTFDISFHPEYARNVNTFCSKLNSIASMAHIKTILNLNLHNDINYMPAYKDVINNCIINDICIAPNYLFSTARYNSEYTDEFFAELKPFDKYLYEYNIKFIDYDGNEKIYAEDDIHKYSYNMFKGFNCRPKMWKITPQGSFINVCTGKNLKINCDNIAECVKCPNDRCNSSILREYHKTAPAEKFPKL